MMIYRGKDGRSMHGVGFGLDWGCKWILMTFAYLITYNVYMTTSFMRNCGWTLGNYPPPTTLLPPFNRSYI